LRELGGEVRDSEEAWVLFYSGLKAVRGGIFPATRRRLDREGPRRSSCEVTARAEAN
jgi:hypothetical protein